MFSVLTKSSSRSVKSHLAERRQVCAKVLLELADDLSLLVLCTVFYFYTCGLSWPLNLSACFNCLPLISTTEVVVLLSFLCDFRSLRYCVTDDGAVTMSCCLSPLLFRLFMSYFSSIRLVFQNVDYQVILVTSSFRRIEAFFTAGKRRNLHFTTKYYSISYHNLSMLLQYSRS